MGFARFMASGFGRALRIVAGLALVGLGVWLVLVHTIVGGVIVGVIGLIPLLAGLTDICVFAPLFGAPISGQRIRSSQPQPMER